MKTLKSQLAELTNEMALSKQATESKQIIDEYQTIHKKLQPVATSLHAVVEASEVLKNVPSSMTGETTKDNSAKENLTTAIYCLQEFASCWEEQGHLARQSDEFASVEAALTKCCNSEKEHTDQIWREFLAALDKRSVVEQHFLDQQKTLGFMQVYNDYCDARREFDDLRTAGPNRVDTVQKLQSLCNKMQQLKNGMEFKMPPEVQALFDQLNSVSGKASLRLLTPDVIDWLDEHNMLDTFVVQRHRAY
ncbi:protein DpdI [Corallincola platygyrae]|uniref:Protein DpdI n=1 Tax=Corallincola platygyrae TaxID=1193278 RepID=A0ABW4XI30_9GAMM